jgi:hypothetical protein
MGLPEAATGIDALLELIMHGEYIGQDAVRRQKESVDLRATAVGVFEVCVRSLVVPLRCAKASISSGTIR